MIGRTNVLVRGTHYEVGPVTILRDNYTYLPSDYGYDFFTQAVVPESGNNYLQKLLRHELTKLTPIELGTSMYMSNYMFYRDTYLEELSLPTSMVSVGNYCFAYSHLTKLHLNCPNLTSLSTYCFQEVPISDLYINAPNLQTCTNAFYYNRAIVHPVIENIKVIDASMFYDDYNLEDVDIPATCTTVGTSAFAMASGHSLSSYPTFYVTFHRHAAVEGSTIVCAVTDIKSNSLNNRDTSKYRLIVPFDSICGYRVRFKAVNNNYLGRTFAYYDAQDNDVLPTSTTQQYGAKSGSYTVTWYQDRDCTVAAPTGITAGRYYGVITVVQEDI